MFKYICEYCSYYTKTFECRRGQSVGSAMDMHDKLWARDILLGKRKSLHFPDICPKFKYQPPSDYIRTDNLKSLLRTNVSATQLELF